MRWTSAAAVSQRSRLNRVLASVTPPAGVEASFSEDLTSPPQLNAKIAACCCDTSTVLDAFLASLRPSDRHLFFRECMLNQGPSRLLPATAQQYGLECVPYLCREVLVVPIRSALPTQSASWRVMKLAMLPRALATGPSIASRSSILLWWIGRRAIVMLILFGPCSWLRGTWYLHNQSVFHARQSSSESAVFAPC